MNCPNCQLINPESAERCDCGYDFATGRIERSYLERPPVGRASSEQAGLRAIAVLLGVAAGGFMCLFAGLALFLDDSGEGLNPGTLLLVGGALQVVGAALAAFHPGLGGALMLMAAAFIVLLLATGAPGLLPFSALQIMAGLVALLAAANQPRRNVPGGPTDTARPDANNSSIHG